VRVVIFGASGMVGQGALLECLRDDRVERVLVVTRSPIAQSHAKLDELVHRDFQDFSTVADRLTGFDVCFFCLGVASAGMSEDAYRKITRDIPVAAGRVLAGRNPAMTFVFVSGAGSDATERGRVMWARVKGEAENAVRALPFRACYVFRPAFIQPLDGIRSRTRLYSILYSVTRPLLPLLRRLLPRYVLTTRQLGRAMLVAARDGAPKPVLESADIAAIAPA
jgi:uncharacterized protein YbjT (DUF2867 family)